MASSITIFGREPALILEAAKAALAVLAAFVIPDLSPDMQAAIMAVGYTLLSTAQAFLTRPVAPTVFNGLIQSTVALVGYFGADVSADKTALLLVLTQAVTAVMTRQAITPTTAPAVPPPPA